MRTLGKINLRSPEIPILDEFLIVKTFYSHEFLQKFPAGLLMFALKQWGNKHSSFSITWAQEMQSLEPCPRLAEAESLRVRASAPKIVLGKNKVEKCSFNL